ncbi:hypothetical protein P170DRAFT_177111 [Aspergillus steynii IBT 23096]|uniref:Uncharacterized protein n=1 Tax=Aspergillus steynii IBT 23096 TaxID=1392250 RepID=A0A2I2G8H1_9EURO|nr:uncharacterized protein P170DRAFT_177111 [Aspergillus steynii IBT 23096]PLB49176.1 hypothetical protein P170DRAFT_177111 [Aspergillus steynii IBT 23096]
MEAKRRNGGGRGHAAGGALLEDLRSDWPGRRERAPIELFRFQIKIVRRDCDGPVSTKYTICSYCVVTGSPHVLGSAVNSALSGPGRALENNRLTPMQPDQARTPRQNHYSGSRTRLSVGPASRRRRNEKRWLPISIIQNRRRTNGVPQWADCPPDHRVRRNPLALAENQRIETSPLSTLVAKSAGQGFAGNNPRVSS